MKPATLGGDDALHVAVPLNGPHMPEELLRLDGIQAAQ